MNIDGGLILSTIICFVLSPCLSLFVGEGNWGFRLFPEIRGLLVCRVAPSPFSKSEV